MSDVKNLSELNQPNPDLPANLPAAGLSIDIGLWY